METSVRVEIYREDEEWVAYDADTGDAVDHDVDYYVLHERCVRGGYEVASWDVLDVW